jgi:hypothetical protein
MLIRNSSLITIFLILFLPFFAYGEVIQSESFEEIEQTIQRLMKDRNPENSLVLISLERCLIKPTDKALQKQDPNYKSLSSQAMKKVRIAKMRFFNELVLSQYDHELTSSFVSKFIQNIQQEKIPLIVTTNNISGPFNKIPNLDEWTFEYLKKKDVDLSIGKFKNTHIILKDSKEVDETHPTFYQGLLSLNKVNGNNSLQQVLPSLVFNELKWQPDIVFAIYHDQGTLDILEQQLKASKKDIEFIGFLYVRSEEQNSELSPKEYLQFWQDFANKLSNVTRGKK